MDTSAIYKVMCQRATELQSNWKPQEGDFISTTASYCDEGNCSEQNLCLECAESSNTFVISGQFDYAKDVGGTHWFFGGHGCVRGDGNRINSTACYVMTKDGFSTIYPNSFESSSQKEKIWLPRQDQLQSMLWSGLTDVGKIREFIDYLDTEAEYNPHTDSLESIWLGLYMRLKHNKKWNRISNVLQWEEI